jgi:hypothetical protein
VPDSIVDEVREAVARCIPENRVLRIRPVSAAIAASHAEEGLSPAIIAEELLAAGLAAGVPIENETPSDQAGGSATRRQPDF